MRWVGKCAGRLPETTATLRFLTDHPAASWAADERFAALKERCRQTAAAYLNEREKAGQPLTGDALRRFRDATGGLGIEELMEADVTP